MAESCGKRQREGKLLQLSWLSRTGVRAQKRVLGLPLSTRCCSCLFTIHSTPSLHPSIIMVSNTRSSLSYHPANLSPCTQSSDAGPCLPSLASSPNTSRSQLTLPSSRPQKQRKPSPSSTSEEPEPSLVNPSGTSSVHWDRTRPRRRLLNSPTCKLGIVSPRGLL